MASTVILVGFLYGPISAPGPALAATVDDPSCPSYNDTFVPWTWTASGNSEYGIRAPVQTSFDSLLCTNSGDSAFATGWIAIQATNDAGITQIGIIHRWNNGSSAWCRVWAIGTGAPNYYDCGNQSNGTYVYFEIYQNTNVHTGANSYVINDCGTSGGYGSCTVMNSTQSPYSDPQGDVAAETNFACTVQIMGSASAPQNYGTSASQVEGLVQDWGTRDWNYQSQDNDCTSDYHGVQGNSTFSTWDSRN
jgi:hypothetical protein